MCNFTGNPVAAKDFIITRQGGRSVCRTWIHPRLMTHFLTWCCPEFAEEVIHVFNSFVAGDPSLVTESVSIRAQAHEEELKANEADPELQAEIAKKYEDELVARAKAIEDAANTIQHLRALNLATQDDLDKKVVELKANKDEYEAVLKLRAAREAQLETDLEESKADLNDASEERNHLQQAMDVDSARPLNVFKDMDQASIPSSTRHQETRLWYAARNITINTCIFQTQQNYVTFMDAVTDAAHPVKMFNDAAKASYRRKLSSHLSRVRNQCKRAIYKEFKALKVAVQQEIVQKVAVATKAMFKEVFALDLTEDEFTIKTCLNNITMYQLLCTHLCVVYNVKYSTEVETKYLAKMALNMTDFTNGRFKVALGNDYAEFDEHYADVDLLTV